MTGHQMLGISQMPPDIGIAQDVPVKAETISAANQNGDGHGGKAKYTGQT
jgi:hypothetical protein